LITNEKTKQPAFEISITKTEPAKQATQSIKSQQIPLLDQLTFQKLNKSWNFTNTLPSGKLT